MMKKKLLSLILAVVLMITVIPASALAVDEFVIEDGVLTAYNGSGGDVVVPDGVTEIDVQAFNQCDSLTSITIPASVEYIEVGAFSTCINLASITVDENNTIFTSADGILYVVSEAETVLRAGLLTYPIGKADTSFTVPENVVAIESYAFYGCTNLTDVTITADVSIGAYAFGKCSSLATVTFLDRATFFYSSMFSECAALTSVIFYGGLIVLITDNPFNDSPNVTIYGISGSFVERYFTENLNIPFVAITAPEASETEPGAVSAVPATPTSSTVLVNGEAVSFDAYNINDNNYFKLRDLAYILNGTEAQFKVEWDEANNAIKLTSGHPYTTVGGEMSGKGSGEKTAAPTSSRIYLDGVEISLTAYNIGGNNYFKLRDVGQAFDFNVSWDGGTNTIIIDTSESYTAD